MSKDVYIHAGAHRTGTSSFQMCLAANRTALTQAGFDLAYPGRDGIPDARLRLKLPRGNVGEHRLSEFADGMRGHLKRISPKPNRPLILSEENIPGPMHHFNDGRFFPFAVNRLMSLSMALDDKPAHILFVVRSYDEMMISAYRKRAEDNPMPDFRDLVPEFLKITKGWPWLLRHMRDRLGARNITVLAYEKRGPNVDLLRSLVPGLDDVTLQEPQRTLNLSATDSALIALQKLYRAGEVLERADWQAVVAEHASERDNLGVAAFDTPEREMFKTRYSQDLERIRRMRGITLID